MQKLAGELAQHHREDDNANLAKDLFPRAVQTHYRKPQPEYNGGETQPYFEERLIVSRHWRLPHQADGSAKRDGQRVYDGSNNECARHAPTEPARQRSSKGKIAFQLETSSTEERRF